MRSRLRSQRALVDGAGAALPPGPRRRHHQDPRPAGMGAPAEVELVVVARHLGVEAADGPEQVGPHQQARRRQAERVAHPVVLLLVELAGVDGGRRLAELVGAHAGADQPGRIVPVDELGADDAAVGAVRLLDQQADGAGSRATSSWRKQKKPAPSTSSSASLAAPP